MSQSYLPYCTAVLEKTQTTVTPSHIGAHKPDGSTHTPRTAYQTPPHLLSAPLQPYPHLPPLITCSKKAIAAQIGCVFNFYQRGKQRLFMEGTPHEGRSLLAKGAAFCRILTGSRPCCSRPEWWLARWGAQHILQNLFIQLQISQLALPFKLAPDDFVRGKIFSEPEKSDGKRLLFPWKSANEHYNQIAASRWRNEKEVKEQMWTNNHTISRQWTQNPTITILEKLL